MKKIRRNTMCSECMNRSNERGKRIEAYYNELRNMLQNKYVNWFIATTPCSSQHLQDFDELEHKTELSERSASSSPLHLNSLSKKSKDKSTQYASHDHSHKHLECNDEIVIQIPRHLKLTSITLQLQDNRTQTPSSAHRSSLSDRF